MRSSFRNALLLLLVLLGIFVGRRLFSPHDGQLTIRNASTRHIRFVQVTVCDQPVMFSGMDPGEERSNAYAVQDESAYDITVHFASGDVLQGRMGFVPGNADQRDVLVVDDAGMGLAQDDN